MQLGEEFRETENELHELVCNQSNKTMFTTLPDGKHDGPLEPLANIKTGLFVSTSEKLQNAEHNRVCCTEKEMGACFIVVRFQKCPLL